MRTKQAFPMEERLGCSSVPIGEAGVQLSSHGEAGVQLGSHGDTGLQLGSRQDV